MPDAKTVAHMLAPGSISKLSTKCGKRITPRSRGLLAMHPALATCVACAAVGNAELEVEKLKRGHVPDEHKKYHEWADGPDSGMSSMALVRATTGAHVGRWRDYQQHPLDPDDFGRCYRVLQLFPELRTDLAKVAALSQEWSRLIAAWDDLELLFTVVEPHWPKPRMYDRMQELING